MTEFANNYQEFSIVGVVEAKVNEQDEAYVICPKCEPHRKKKGQKKLAVNVVKGTWYCQHCGHTGGLTPKDWVKNKPIIEKKHLQDLTDKQREYFNKRGISNQTLDSREVRNATVSIRQKHNNTFVEKPCIAFSYRENGWLTMIKYRDGQKNFKIEKGSKLIPWGIDWVRNNKNYCVITEGEIDTLSFHEIGIVHSCSVPNGSSISVEENEYYVKTGKVDSGNHLALSYFDHTYQYFEEVEIIYIATDNDGAGIKLRNEIGRRFGYDKCRIIKFHNYTYEDKKGKMIVCNDGNDVLWHIGPEALQEAFDRAESFPLDDVVTIDDVSDKINEQYTYGLKKGKPTGVRDLEAHFRWKTGHLVGFNGYGNMGKSTFMFNLLILAAIKYGYKFGCYLPENYPVEDAYIIFIEIYIGNTIDLDVNGRATEKDMAIAKKFISEHFEFIDREEGYTPEELRQVARRMIRQRGIIGFVTDPWNALNHRYTGSLDQYLENELSAEQRFCTTHNIIKVIVVHPPTPQGEDRKNPSAPSVFQITGGAVWNKKFYEILCVHLKDENKEEVISEVHVQKVKTPKLIGVKTRKEYPVLLRFRGRDHHFLNYNETDPILIAKNEQKESFQESEDITLF
jgi:twinkle protein